MPVNIKPASRIQYLRLRRALPASPCLSSRLQTGVAVKAETLHFVASIERLLGEALAPTTARCRILHDGVKIELDPESLARIKQPESAALRDSLARLCSRHGAGGGPRFEAYVRGSAFVGAGDHDL